MRVAVAGQRGLVKASVVERTSCGVEVAAAEKCSFGKSPIQSFGPTLKKKTMENGGIVVVDNSFALHAIAELIRLHFLLLRSTWLRTQQRNSRRPST